MQKNLIINEDYIIPGNCIEISSVRASGPGGQNVNKVSDCIKLKFDPVKWNSLPSYAFERLMVLAGSRKDSSGSILLTGQKYRDRIRNIEDVCTRLKELIVKALKVPKKRKATKPSKSAVERRIKRKKINSDKKSFRKKVIIY